MKQGLLIEKLNEDVSERIIRFNGKRIGYTEEPYVPNSEEQLCLLHLSLNNISLKDLKLGGDIREKQLLKEFSPEWAKLYLEKKDYFFSMGIGKVMDYLGRLNFVKGSFYRQGFFMSNNERTTYEAVISALTEIVAKEIIAQS